MLLLLSASHVIHLHWLSYYKRVLWELPGQDHEGIWSAPPSLLGQCMTAHAEHEHVAAAPQCGFTWGLRHQGSWLQHPGDRLPQSIMQTVASCQTNSAWQGKCALRHWRQPSVPACSQLPSDVPMQTRAADGAHLLLRSIPSQRLRAFSHPTQGALAAAPAGQTYSCRKSSGAATLPGLLTQCISGVLKSHPLIVPSTDTCGSY